MNNILEIQAQTIDMLQSKIQELTKQNLILDKRCKGLYGEYQLLQYEIRSLPTTQEYVKLQLELVQLRQKLQMMKEFN